MAHEYYDSSGAPATSSSGSSLVVRTEFDAIEAGFNKLPALAGNADKAVFVNAGASGLTSVTAAVARGLLGIAIGSNVQAWDADLDAIAALVSAADRLPYATGAQAWALTIFTAAGRALIDDADAAAQRTTLGLGSIATQAASAVAITGGTIVGLTGFAIRSSGAAFDLTVATDTIFTVGRTLTIRPGDAARILTFSGDATISGTNTGDQTITLTGGVTGSGTGSFAATVITNANLTGPITSAGNATSVAAQTGTGSTFVMQTAPTLTQLTLSAAASKIIPGATSLSLRNNADNADNILIADAGGVTLRTTLTFSTAASQIIPGATSLSHRNNANNADNLLISDAGNHTLRGDVIIGGASIVQNSQSIAYTLVATDANKHILHPSADTTARTFTIPANSSVAYAIGTAVTFVNQNAAGVLTIAITTDTMRLAGAGTTGSRTLAANGIATALKVTATEWIISGTGLT